MDILISTFTSPGPKLIQLGPLTLRWYGVLIALAVLIGLNLSSKLASKRGLENGLINDLLPILVLASILGARIYYVLFEWRFYKNNWLEALEIWKGGIAIHGALITGSLAVFIFCRLKNQPILDVFDVLMPSVVLGQAIGRWGNFFNNEAFGIPTNLPWKLFIPFQHRPTDFLDYNYFHPTFLYESLWNILVFIILISIFFKTKNKIKSIPSGTITFSYLLLYSIGRLVIESLRVDPLCIGAVPPFCEGGIRAAKLMSIILISISGYALWRLSKKGRRKSLGQAYTNSSSEL